MWNSSGSTSRKVGSPVLSMATDGWVLTIVGTLGWGRRFGQPRWYFRLCFKPAHFVTSRQQYNRLMVPKYQWIHLIDLLSTCLAPENEKKNKYSKRVLASVSTKSSGRGRKSMILPCFIFNLPEQIFIFILAGVFFPLSQHHCCRQDDQRAAFPGMVLIHTCCFNVMLNTSPSPSREHARFHGKVCNDLSPASLCQFKHTIDFLCSLS